MCKRLMFALLFAVGMLGVSAPAHADSITTLTQGGLAATVTVVGNTATLTFGSGLDSDYTDQVAIHVTNGATVTGGSASSGAWTIQSGQNSVNCDGTGNWFCATSGSDQSFKDLSISWTFSGGSPTDLVSAQFAVCSSSTGDCAPGTMYFVTNFSQSATAPEPGTLALLGIGLLGVGILSRRRAASFAA